MKLKRTYLTRVDDFAKKVYILDEENDSKFWGFADFDEINNREQLNEINACAYKTNGDVLCWVKGGNRILVGMTLLHVPLLSEDKHEVGLIPSKIYVEIEDVNVLGWLPTIHDDTNEPYVEGPNELDDIIEYIKNDSIMKNGIDVEKIEMLPLPSWQKKIVKEAASDAINDYLSENFKEKDKSKDYEDLDKEELQTIFHDKLDEVDDSFKKVLVSKLTKELKLLCAAAFDGDDYNKSTEDILRECLIMIDEEIEKENDEELSLEEELKEEILGKIEKKDEEKSMEENKVRRTKEDLLNDLIKEQNELEGKICRLDMFVIKVRNHDYDKSIHEISDYELQFMEDQLRAMRKYLKALVARIAMIKNED